MQVEDQVAEGDRRVIQSFDHRIESSTLLGDEEDAPPSATSWAIRLAMVWLFPYRVGLG